MRTRLLFACALLGGCVGPAPVEVGPEPTAIWEGERGIGFELPGGWVSQAQGGGTVYSGPRGTSAWFTTITVQSADPGPPAAGLQDALERAYQPVAADPGFAWDWREPASVGGVPALLYGVRFELHEALRRKAGVLLWVDGGALDVAYGASDTMFPEGLPVFEGVLSSLWIDPDHRGGS